MSVYLLQKKSHVSYMMYAINLGLACTRPEHSISPDTEARLILSDLMPAAVIEPDFDVRLQKSDSMKFSASMNAEALSDAARGNK